MMPDTHSHNLRVPPSAVPSEQAVLGAFLVDATIVPKYRETLVDSDFYRRDHRLIFRAILDAADAGKQVDAVALGDDPSLAEHREYLVDLALNAPSAANLAAHVDLIREKRLLREFVEIGTDIANAGFSPDGETPAEVFNLAYSRISALTPHVTLDAPPPVDLFDDGRTHAPRLHPDHVPPALRRFVFECSAIKGAEPETLFLSALIVCSMACHDRFRVQPRANEPGWTESARLWGLVVADASKKKTPVMRLAMMPLEDLNADMSATYASARAKHDFEAKVYAQKEKKRAKAEASGAGLADPDDLAPKAPKHERIIINDVTAERAADLLADNERGLLRFNDELASFLTSFGQYNKNGGGADKAFYLRCYNGGGHHVDRMSRPPLWVPNESLRILGGIQPDRARTIAAGMDDDGLFQRFITIVLPPGYVEPSKEEEPTEVINAYNALVKHLWATNPGEGRVVIPLSPEAREVREQMSQWVAPLLSADMLPPMMRSHLAKWEGLFPRLCLTYHMIACAAGRKFPTTSAISGSTATRVAHLMKHWLMPHAVAFYTGIAGGASPMMVLAKQIANLILAKSATRITKRDCAQNVPTWRHTPEWQQNASLALLEQVGWLLPASVEQGKRAPGWTVNPRVHVEFATRAAAVAAERERVGEILNNHRRRDATDTGNESAAG